MAAEKFPIVSDSTSRSPETLARAGAERWARGERAGAHAETRPERRRDVAEKVAAAGAMAVICRGGGHIGAHPLAAGFAKRIDALHGETGQVLHFPPSEAAKHSSIPRRPVRGQARKSLSSPSRPNPAACSASTVDRTDSAPRSKVIRVAREPSN